VCIDNGQDGVDNIGNDKNEHSATAAAAAAAPDSDKAADKDDNDDDDELNLLNEEDVAKLGLMTVTLQQQKGKQHSCVTLCKCHVISSVIFCTCMLVNVTFRFVVSPNTSGSIYLSHNLNTESRDVHHNLMVSRSHLAIKGYGNIECLNNLLLQW